MSLKGYSDMIIDTNSLITNYKIDTVADLKNLSAIEKGLGMKVNKSALARKFNIDRRTVKKYIEGK